MMSCKVILLIMQKVMLLMLTSSVDKGSGVVDERCVRAGNSLVLHVSVVLMGEGGLIGQLQDTSSSYYLLVFVDKVVNNLGPAVGQVHHILACDI